MDLFKSKKEVLLAWCKQQGKFIRTSEIIRWGSTNFCNGADRLARQLREDGLLQRLTRQELKSYQFSTKEGIYRVVT